MKKIMAISKSLVLSMIVLLSVAMPVKAAEVGDCIDGSYLTSENSSEVTILNLSRGVYLRSGSSTIAKAGEGKVAAGGTTIAQTTVSSVGVNVRVERLVNGSWQVYTSWSATRYNAMSVSSSKTISVPSGYYYRTHCLHSANSDASGSYSNGIWI
ncbi:DUF6147 family protein [Bariatricus massiliensis]|uniref:DUF6147 family protein n=1 Tax=Bariatricus massiliensis TaxID=1745713 RepID=A0ABS8DH34_9FIRM|nr:DUF6147 family protein [Bariatricus massiliensis]MCB7304721.1 DUF6147 family protein [Bariatricus massiliensis]MCB7375275.1 DUF6147 family protein [Bariatricus massiliensis]MCB7387735.1 DUF6147 family protein [Bariatricus massiliensis]MCB7412176.1 DUF6147 family protein [Bariatricus massiliensis]MCQ5254443.1 DUF6147 family protein [Bariatricus massiliensis]